MTIEGIKGSIQGIQSLPQPKIDGKQLGGKGEGGFADMFIEAVNEADMMQKDADKKIEGLVLGQGVSTHDAMIALEKADVAFQLMNQVRSKIVRAYEEIMRTQI